MVKRLMLHANLVLSLMFAVFIVLNYRNPRMGFLNGSISVWLLGFLVVLSIANCVMAITDDYHRRKRAAAREARKRKERQLAAQQDQTDVR